jgi:hypothetical protein
MQSVIDVGVGSDTGEGVLDVAEDDIRSSSTTATSLVTSGQFNRRRASGIYILRTLVRYVYLPLSTQLREQVEQWCGDFGIAAFNS